MTVISVEKTLTILVLNIVLRLVKTFAWKNINNSGRKIYTGWNALDIRERRRRLQQQKTTKQW
jgi:hypothetical protein